MLFQAFTSAAKINVRLQVHTAVNIKNVGFWDVTPCDFVDGCQRFG
jgi:hypothetical protein